MKTLTRLSGLFLFLLSVNTFAQSAIRINFAQNAISHEWRGTIANRGNQDFVLRLGRGQMFEVGGPHVFCSLHTELHACFRASLQAPPCTKS